MAFDTNNYLPKLKQLTEATKFAPKRSGVGSTLTGRAGSASRARTAKMIGLGQKAAEETKIRAESSARGVRKMFDQVDVDREEQDADMENAAWLQAIEESLAESKAELQDKEGSYDALALTEELYGKKGTETGKVASHSYFNIPIIEGGLRGTSREAGGASPEVQQEVVNKIVEYGSRLEMTDYQIAYTLAIARHESGFNPDAAAKSSSASGVGQFINDTGIKYGLNDQNRWDVDAQVQALIEHTMDNFDMAKKAGYGDEYVYAYHHDGAGLGGSGLSKSKKFVMPFVPKYLKLVKDYRGAN